MTTSIQSNASDSALSVNGQTAVQFNTGGTQGRIPSGTCVQSGGGLTFTLNPCVLDIRSATQTNGVMTPTLINTAVTLALPSGGTLGFPTTISGDIIVVCMGNGELACAALAGGLQMDEKNLISTTAIGAGSTANNVWYSTTARTNQPYRVVQGVTAANTAGAWGNPTLVQGVGGVALPAIQRMVQSVVNTTTGGTSIDFSSIPSWAKRITLCVNGLSLSGTSAIRVQLGVAGTPETSGYVGVNSNILSASANAASVTAGIDFGGGGAAYVLQGQVIITNLTGNTWTFSGSLTNVTTTLFASNCVGAKPLAGVLNMLRVTTVNGTDTFDANAGVSVLYEG